MRKTVIISISCVIVILLVILLTTRQNAEIISKSKQTAAAKAVEDSIKRESNMRLITDVKRSLPASAHLFGRSTTDGEFIGGISIWDVPDDDRRKLAYTWERGIAVTLVDFTIDTYQNRWYKITKRGGDESGWIKENFIKN